MLHQPYGPSQSALLAGRSIWRHSHAISNVRGSTTHLSKALAVLATCSHYFHTSERTELAFTLSELSPQEVQAGEEIRPIAITINKTLCAVIWHRAESTPFRNPILGLAKHAASGYSHEHRKSLQSSRRQSGLCRSQSVHRLLQGSSCDKLAKANKSSQDDNNIHQITKI